MKDYLINNVRIADVEAGGVFAGSLGIEGGKISGVFRAGERLPEAGKVIDGEGGVLSPGFIDIHAHSDNSRICAERLLAMGVTTVLSGNCGFSPVDFAAFFREFGSAGYPVNQAEQAGHTELRKAAGQTDNYSAASREVIERTKALCGKAFDEGAAGLSFGLEYAPGAAEDEVLELTEFARARGKPVSIHTRLTNDPGLRSVREALELSVKTGARVIISHLVYMYRGDVLKRALELIDDYRRAGADVWADSGMYTAFSSQADTAIFDEDIFLAKGYSFDKLRAGTGKYAGQYLDKEKYYEIRKNAPDTSFIYDPGQPDDVFTAFSLPGVMVSTDCFGYREGEGHPQGAATYPFFLRALVKERKQLSMIEGLRRCTLVPAMALDAAGKGRIKDGADADLVILDWERLRENADFLPAGNPTAPPSGVRYVFVNGRLTIENGKRVPGVLAGRADFLSRA